MTPTRNRSFELAARATGEGSGVAASAAAVDVVKKSRRDSVYGTIIVSPVDRWDVGRVVGRFTRWGDYARKPHRRLAVKLVCGELSRMISLGTCRQHMLDLLACHAMCLT